MQASIQRRPHTSVIVTPPRMRISFSAGSERWRICCRYTLRDLIRLALVRLHILPGQNYLLRPFSESFNGLTCVQRIRSQHVRKATARHQKMSVTAGRDRSSHTTGIDPITLAMRILMITSGKKRDLLYSHTATSSDHLVGEPRPHQAAMDCH